MRPWCDRMMIGAIAVALAGSPASAEWSAASRQEFSGGCTQSCRNQRTPPSDEQCVRYCRCVLNELEVSYDDARKFGEAYEAQDPGVLQRIDAVGLMCRRRVLQ